MALMFFFTYLETSRVLCLMWPESGVRNIVFPISNHMNDQASCIYIWMDLHVVVMFEGKCQCENNTKQVF